MSTLQQFSIILVVLYILSLPAVVLELKGCETLLTSKFPYLAATFDLRVQAQLVSTLHYPMNLKFD